MSCFWRMLGNVVVQGIKRNDKRNQVYVGRVNLATNKYRISFSSGGGEGKGGVIYVAQHRVEGKSGEATNSSQTAQTVCFPTQYSFLPRRTDICMPPPSSTALLLPPSPLFRDVWVFLFSLLYFISFLRSLSFVIASFLTFIFSIFQFSKSLCAHCFFLYMGLLFLSFLHFINFVRPFSFVIAYFLSCIFSVFQKFSSSFRLHCFFL